MRADSGIYGRRAPGGTALTAARTVPMAKVPEKVPVIDQIDLACLAEKMFRLILPLAVRGWSFETVIGGADMCFAQACYARIVGVQYQVRIRAEIG